MSIKTVAIVGAAGALGSVVLEKLLASGRYSIRVLRRIGSSSTFASGVDVVDVDFSSVESIKSALEGQDAVVSCVGTEWVSGQSILAEAAAAAGVKRILPSEFGSNLDNLKTRQLPVFVGKVKLQDRIIELSKTSGLTYTFVYNSAFLDWGLQHGFVLKTADYKPMIMDGGDRPFSTTTLATTADAVVGILDHPEETKNRAVYIHDLVTTQNKLLALAKSLAPNAPWEPFHVKVDDMVANSDARLAKGLFDMETFGPYLFRAILDPAYGSVFDKNDNELLGLKGKTDEDIIEILRPLLT